jgi:molybdopterin-guanine dinucleotide biosynthesis protein A
VPLSGDSPQRPVHEPARHCAILAGGRGSRIGGNKGLIEIAGRTLIQRAADTARQAELEPLIVAKPATELGEHGCRVVLEPEIPAHPLLGIATALAEIGEPLVVCACDLPLLPAELLTMLAEERATVAVVSGPRGVEPLLGRYEVSAGPELARAAHAGDPARATVKALGASLIEPGTIAGEAPETYLFNVNTPADRAGAERLLSRR